MIGIRSSESTLAGTVLGVLFLDQAGKFIAINKVLIGVDVYKNHNALFGASFSYAFFVFLGAILLIFAYYHLGGARELTVDQAPAIASGLLIGGVVSNLLDRVFYGYVIDYLGLFDLFSFNLADGAIFAGVLMLGWKVFQK